MKSIFAMIALVLSSTNALAARITCLEPKLADFGVTVVVVIDGDKANLMWGRNSYSGGSVLGTDEVSLSTDGTNPCVVKVASTKKQVTYFTMQDFNRRFAHLKNSDSFNLGATGLDCELDQALIEKLCAPPIADPKAVLPPANEQAKLH